MDRKLVQSNNVASISDRNSDGAFEIGFKKKDGAETVYRHTGVPLEIYEGLMASRSKGAYYYQHLRNRFGVEKV